MLTARIPEFDAFTNIVTPKIDPDYKKIPPPYLESALALVSNEQYLFELSPFDKKEVANFILKYDDGSKSMSEREFEQYSSQIYEQSRGFPMIAIFLVLQLGLEKHINSIIKDYLNNVNSLTAMIICSVLSLSNIRISDTLLDELKIIKYCYDSINITLVRYDDKSWQTIHTKWDKEFLILLFKSNEAFYNNIQYLSNAFNYIFALKKSNISYLSLLTLYRTTFKIFPDVINKINIRAYLNNEEKSNLIAVIGNEYFNLKEFGKALEFSKSALVINPGNASAYSIGGDALYFSGKFEEAAEMHRKAIELEPNILGHHINLIRSLRKFSYSDAITAADAAVEKFKENTNPDLKMALFNNVGTVFLSEKNFIEARNFLRQSNKAKKRGCLFRKSKVITGWRYSEASNEPLSISAALQR